MAGWVSAITPTSSWSCPSVALAIAASAEQVGPISLHLELPGGRTPVGPALLSWLLNTP